MKFIQQKCRPDYRPRVKRLSSEFNVLRNDLVRKSIYGIH